MGTQFNWLCTNDGCNAEIRQVSGGFDRGFITQTQTRICTSCKKVEDYKVGLVSDPTHQTFTDAELEKHKITEPKCDKCGNVTIVWDRKCPKCGSAMRRGLPMVLWD